MEKIQHRKRYFGKFTDKHRSRGSRWGTWLRRWRLFRGMLRRSSKWRPLRLTLRPPRRPCASRGMRPCPRLLPPSETRAHSTRRFRQKPRFVFLFVFIRLYSSLFVSRVVSRVVGVLYSSLYSPSNDGCPALPLPSNDGCPALPLPSNDGCPALPLSCFAAIPAVRWSRRPPENDNFPFPDRPHSGHVAQHAT